MTNVKKSAVVIAIVTVAAVVWIGIIICSAMSPTKGKHISRYLKPAKALLVIDIQEDYTGETAKPPFPYRSSGQLIAATNQVIADAVKKGYVIVYIRQEFDGAMGKVFGRGTAMRGTPGAQIDKRISIVSRNEFSKPKGDAFSNPELESYLIERRVDELFLTGLDAQYCVHLTARGALNRGYKVSIVKDAIALRAENKWNELLAKYTQEGIHLLSGAEFAQLE
jgi:nicotinamidase/pyrazinamidase